MTLYELTTDYQYLYDLLSQGEIDEQTFADSVEGMMFDEQLESKAEEYAKIIKMLEGDAEVAKAEATRLSARKTAFEANAKRMKDRLYDTMKATGREKFKTALFSFGIQANPPALVVDDVNSILEIPRYKKDVVWDESMIDKKALKDDLKSGEVIPGAHLEQGESLRIR